jgi:hypothetical protein
MTVPCAGCGAPLTGRFCAACGEEALDPAARTVRHFVTASLLDEIVHLDSRFWRTIGALLFKPAQLSLDYIGGRRRVSIGPVKLLLAAIFLFVLLTRGGFLVTLMIGSFSLSIAPTAPPRGATIRDSVLIIDRFGVLESQLNARIGSGPGPSGPAQTEFQERIRRFAQPLAFGNVFFLAAGLFLLFRSRLPYYVDHLVFSMHTVSFVLLSSLLLVPGPWISEERGSGALVLILPVLAWQFGYLATAIRRMYFASAASLAGARMRAFGVAIVVYLLNGVFVTAVQVLAGWIAIRDL